jgi:putative heme iron utilization protein
MSTSTTTLEKLDMSTDTPKKKKISFELSPEADAILEAMATKLGTTKSDVLKKGLKLVEVAINANKQKRDLATVDVMGNVYERIIT